MTDRKELYDLAFQYKKAGIWKKMWDSDLFAVKLDDGETGYVSIMGKNGEYCSLGLYIGMEGIKSYFYTADHSEDTNVSYLISHELLLQQECLQLALESKDDLHPDELDELREYAKENQQLLQHHQVCRKSRDGQLLFHHKDSLFPARNSYMADYRLQY